MQFSILHVINYSYFMRNKKKNVHATAMVLIVRMNNLNLSIYVSIKYASDLNF